MEEVSAGIIDLAQSLDDAVREEDAVEAADLISQIRASLTAIEEEFADSPASSDVGDEED